MSRTKGEALREIIEEAADKSFYDGSDGREIAAAIVEELGITRRTVEVLREMVEWRGHLDQIQGYMANVTVAADAIEAILEAAGVEK